MIAKGSLVCRNGRYYYRCTVGGKRVEKALKTRNRKEAVKKAGEMARIADATSKEVLAARVSELNEWSSQRRRLELDCAWEQYDTHPNRARPATVNIYQRHQSYFDDFVTWAQERKLEFLDEVDDRVVSAYADHLKTLGIGVDTHNKRITRVAHIFKTLSDYTAPETSNWSNPNFKRRDREENGMEARRMPFSKEQEHAIFAVLENDKDTRRNKHELKVLFYRVRLGATCSKPTPIYGCGSCLITWCDQNGVDHSFRFQLLGFTYGDSQKPGPRVSRKSESYLPMCQSPIVSQRILHKPMRPFQAYAPRGGRRRRTGGSGRHGAVPGATQPTRPWNRCSRLETS